MTHSTEYLYGVQPNTFKHLAYDQALKFKILSAKQLVEVLIEVPYETRDDFRINKVLSAIKFNQHLLDELKE